MDLTRRSVALYGRFSAGQRERLLHEIARREGVVARDLTGRSDLLVIGALATALIDCGSLGERLRSAKRRRVPVLGERSFVSALAGDKSDEATLPLATALAPTALSIDDANVLAAFDLIGIEEENCRFADASVVRTAGELLSQRRSLADIVRILTRARNLAPLGRHKIVLAPSGEAALKWENGLTTLEGQGYLPLEIQHAGVDELFEQAELLEAGGSHDEAAKLYERCANADRSDPISLFNLGNIRLEQRRHDEAANAYRRALARDSGFVEARYNLALTLEALGKLEEASEELGRVLASEPAHSDAVFNLAQMLMKTGSIAKAKSLYERYLALDPPADWAATARKAITYCTARLSG
jgi:tetratricopeptide (TPR) repeat protein